MPAQGGFVSSSQQQSPDPAVVAGGGIGLAVALQPALRGSLGLEVQRLLPTRARELEPALAPTLRAAAAAPEDHAVDPRRLLRALAGAVVAAGAALREGAEVAALESRAGRVTGVRLV